MPRQGIEPCISRLKAGGFAIEACEAFRARNLERGVRNKVLFVVHVLRVRRSQFRTRMFRELESNQRPPPSKSGFSTSTESPGIDQRVAGAGIEPAPSTFRGWLQYQH